MLKLGIYQHYKGKRYEVLGVAKHSETRGAIAKCRFRHNLQILVNFFENFLANVPHYQKNFEKNFFKIVKILAERAFDDSPLEDLVVYKKLYDDGGLWVRPLKMFLENVKVGGKIMPRFKLIEEK